MRVRRSRQSRHRNAEKIADSKESLTITSKEVQSSLSSQTKQLSQAQEKLGKCVVTSPISGYITVLDDTTSSSTAKNGVNGGGATRQIPVTVGLESDYYVEITGDGLEEGLRVVMPQTVGGSSDSDAKDSAMPGISFPGGGSMPGGGSGNMPGGGNRGSGGRGAAPGGF